MASSQSAPTTLNFCDDLDISSIKDLSEVIKKAALYTIIALIVIGLIYILTFAYLEYKRYNQMKNCVRDYDGGTDEKELMVLISNESHPYIYRWTRYMSSNKRDNIRWMSLILTHPYAILLLCIGLIGLIVIGIQLIIVNKVETTFTNRAKIAFDNTQTSLSQSLFGSTSKDLANASNNAIGDIENTVNDSVFGWLNDGIIPINDTLTSFENGLNEAVENVFNGTFIEDAISNYVQCVIGSKLDALETGLTWIHNNSHVNFSRG